MFDPTVVNQLSKTIRRLTMECIGQLGVGHVGGCLSVADVLAVLYEGEMRIDPKNPQKLGRDRLILSKGHAGPALYATLCAKGYFGKEVLLTLNQLGTTLPSHCNMSLTPGVDMTTGSLGQGFSSAVGVAMGARLKKDGARIFTIIGDGESQEGQIWEAALYAASQNLSNLIAFTDWNGMQIDGPVDQINTMGDLAGKWTAFGWFTQTIDGHNTQAIYEAIQTAKAQGNQPSMILLKTVKGKGISFTEQAGVGSHNMPVSKQQLEAALAELA